MLNAVNALPQLEQAEKLIARVPQAKWASDLHKIASTPYSISQDFAFTYRCSAFSTSSHVTASSVSGIDLTVLVIVSIHAAG